MDKIAEFIKDRWNDTVRKNMEDKGNLLALPFPYTVPCAKDKFQELYYWDTYFACRALVKQGFLEQAKNNCDNFIYEIQQYGFIPNGNRTYYLNRSQPPYFSCLIDLIFEHTQDKDWLRVAVEALEKEYEFWYVKRTFQNGLFHYGHHADSDELAVEVYKSCCDDGRIGLSSDVSEEEMLTVGNHIIAEAESGWDFNPRFDCRCQDFAPIDLNCLIYMMLKLLCKFHAVLGNDDKERYFLCKADNLKALINKYLWCEEKCAFLDYDVVNDCFSSVVSAASLHPLWVKLATREQAEKTMELSEKVLEFDFGISTCDNTESAHVYQWDFPNAWPPLQIVAMDAFSNYGFDEAAERIAEKYVSSVRKSFEVTGDLWEKYNVIDGSTDVQDEYEMPAMMGWSAGAYIVALEKL